MRFALASLAAMAFAACSTQVLQGSNYAPPNDIPIGDPTDRSDAGEDDTDAASLDAALPIDDASTPPANSCTTARDIGTLSGDTAGPSLTATGTCSEWISLRATEDDSSVTGNPLKVTISISGDGFSFFAFVDPIRDDLSCSGPRTSPVVWGDNSLSDDTRTVTIAIVKRGTCDDGDVWSLTATGH